jgi:hypothetical protein
LIHAPQDGRQPLAAIAGQLHLAVALEIKCVILFCVKEQLGMYCQQLLSIVLCS